MKNKKSKIIMLIIVVILLAAVGIVYFVKIVQPNYKAKQHQASIQDFYKIPDPISSEVPGTLLKTEKMDITVPGGGTAYRMLYVSELPDDTPAVSSGMIFIPDTEAPEEGRKIVAWAHGTLGFGNECTPSRSETPLNDMDNWLNGMMQRGWLVVTTDYVGLGVPGDPYYLVGKSESRDVINSVRAARNFDKTNASNQFVAWGHSQGGHSALFTAVYAKGYAPELELIATAAAAPAAELGALLSQQYDKMVAWAIGPDVSVSWPLIYPDLPLEPVLSKQGLRDYKKIAFGCVANELGELELKSAFKEKFFQTDPLNDPVWYEAIKEQTPDISEIHVPLYIAQGLSDTVVLPNTSALLIQKACALDKNITVNWLGDTSHKQVAVVSGPSVVDWMQDRFNGAPVINSCAQSLPVDPAVDPSAPVQ
ncbi:lipase family protein [Patescibacteria group bacterium]|nr:lipase family protein [Patescibacteria group bacterium]